MKRILIWIALFMPMITVMFSCNGPSKERLKSSVHLLIEKGQRADFSHDGKKILYVTKAGGEVEEMVIATGQIRKISTFQRHANVGFYRALYLANGDYILAGGPGRNECIFYLYVKSKNYF